jgi:ureidoglycolate lyase
MVARAIEIRPLTKEAFAPFGDVVEAEGAKHFPINNGTTVRFHDIAKVDTNDEDGKTIISIARAQPFVLPLPIIMLERHPLGSQIFMPLNGCRFIIVVAESGKDGLPDEPIGFLASGHQGVNYAKGTWHHPMIALEAESGFLVVDRGGDGNNLEEHFFDGDGYIIEQV